MLHIIYGADPFARREAFDKLRASLDKDGSLATNTATFEAKATSPQEVMAACNTVPFLGDARLVIVNGLFKSVSGFKGTRGRGKPRTPVPPPDADDDEEDPDEASDPGVWTALADYVPQMPPSTTLLLVDGSVDARNPLLKALAPLAKVERCDPPIEKELPAWVMARAKKIGLKLDAPAARLLAELVGQDPYMLASELDKLLAYAGAGLPKHDGTVIREADVREMVSRAKEHKGWDLTDAIIEGKGATAARVLQEMLEDGTATQQILGMIAQRYRRIAVVRDMLDRGESGSAIAQRTGVKLGYALDKLIDHAQHMPPAAIEAAYQRLLEADLDVKRGLIDDDRLALELAVQELASRPTAPARR